ncbi:bpX6 domain-containing protein [Orbaceae bacterium ESL0721]|nr:bpX6 domain-containing protein [Orbaceae bacterium ESL0721]
MLGNINHPIASPNLKGYQPIAGIWFPFIWFSEQECANFIVQYWFKGCLVYRFEQGYLLRFPQTISGYAEQYEGWPLINFENRLCSMKLSGSEKALIPEGDIIILMGNSLSVFNYQQGERCDPSLWINIDDYLLLNMDEWPIEVVELDHIDPALEPKSVDEILGESTPKPSKALLKFAKKHHQKRARVLLNKTSDKPTSLFQKIFVVYLVFIFFGLILKLLGALVTSPSLISIDGWIFCCILLICIFLFLRGQKDVQTFFYYLRQFITRASKSAQVDAAPQKEEESEGKPRKINKYQQWRSYLAKLVLLTGLNRLITLKQGNYLNALMKMLEDGNLDDALKHAIPINGRGEATQQAFGTPKPREKLSYSEKVYGENSAIYVDTEIQQQLHQLYRRSFATLDRDNRVEEAAFVLIELLNSVEEGIDYLESKDRLLQALDIAITKDADPNLIVKLCCLTNQWEKAILIAKQHNSFVNAIMLLQQKNQAAADKLRVIWAHTLAEKGEWLQAIDAIWPIKSGRQLAQKWFEYAEKMAPFNGNILVKKLILQPDAITDYQKEIEQLQSDPDRFEQRLAIAQAILAHQHEIKKLHPLLSSLINVIIFDMANHESALTRGDLMRLIDLTQDRTLKADLPSQQLTVRKQQKLSESTTLKSIICSEIGDRKIYAAMPMQSGNYLLALGEAGIIIVNKRGQQLKHFMITAHELVVSYNFNQILAIGRKGDRLYHIHKLDLATENSVSLGYVELDSYLPCFDGLHWSVLSQNRIQVITVEKRLKVNWQVDLEEYQAVKVCASSTDEKWLLKKGDEQYEIWNYALPAHRLIARDDAKIHVNSIILNRYGFDSYINYSEQQQTIFIQKNQYSEYEPLPITVTPEQYDSLSATAMRAFIVFTFPKEDELGQLIHLYHIESGTIKMVIDWMHNNQLSYNTYEDDLIVWDDLGRCGRLNTVRGEWDYFTV